MFKTFTTTLALAFVLTAGAASAQTGMTTGAMTGSMSSADHAMKPMSKADMKTMEKCKTMKPDAMAKSKKCEKVMAMAKPMAAPMAPQGAMSGAMTGSMSGAMKSDMPMKK